jgi:hypothetical protein
VAIRATRCPNHHNETAGKATVSLESRLAVMLSVIPQRKRNTREHRHGVPEIQSALGQRSLPLDRIVSDFHVIYMPTENSTVKLTLGMRYGPLIYL